MPEFKEILQVQMPNLIVGSFSAQQDELAAWASSQHRFPARVLAEFAAHRQLEHAAVDAAMERMPGRLAQASIVHNADGKPEFMDSELGFLSIAHHTREGICYVAVTSSQRAVGCDIEAERPQLKGIAERFLSLDEIDDVGDALDGLCALWAAKESVFKALGPGLDFRKEIRVKWRGPDEAILDGLAVSLRDQTFQLKSCKVQPEEGPSMWVVFGPVEFTP